MAKANRSEDLFTNLGKKTRRSDEDEDQVGIDKEYKPSLLVTDPRNVDFLEFDKTPNLARLEKAGEDGAGGVADSFENYIHRTFASAYDKFDSDSSLRKLATDAKLGRVETPSLKMKKLADDPEDSISSDNLCSLYDEYNNERSGKHEFSVYQPRALGRYVAAGISSRSPIAIKERYRRDSYEPTSSYLEDSVNGYKEKLTDDNKLFERDRSYRAPAGRQVIIDTSKYGRKDGSDVKMSLPRNSYLRKEDSMYVGSDFMVLTLRSPDHWYDRVDKLLKEARDA